MCFWIIWIFRAIQDLKHYLHMGQLKAVTLCLGYHFTLQVWLVFFLLCLSTGFESLPQGLQKTSEPPGLKFLRVLGQMTPWARNDSLGWPPEDHHSTKKHLKKPPEIRGSMFPTVHKSLLGQDQGVKAIHWIVFSSQQQGTINWSDFEVGQQGASRYFEIR